MYRLLTRFLFLLPAETAHVFTLRCLLAAKTFGFLRQKPLTSKRQEVEIAGLRFPNRVGLAAGLDKNAVLGESWAHFGFGFAEIGTVTPLPQAGNPKPRLFRIPKRQALINRMGFNNQGLESVQKRLKKRKHQGFLIGGNLGKNKQTSNDQALEDYLKGIKALHAHVDYFTINVSSPNTPELRALQEPQTLKNLLQPIMELNIAMQPFRPIFVKVDPDMPIPKLKSLLDVLLELGINGIVATNTTTHRSQTDATKALQKTGGLSGAPLFNRALERVQYIAQHTQGKLPIIACGGIDSPEKAKIMHQAGASLIQLYTGFVYQGPPLVKQLVRQLGTFAR